MSQLQRKKHYKKCEICGVRSGRDAGEKRLFMAQFPLDQERCKHWVQNTGNEDLVYIPIEKLHSLKFVCGKHFEKKCFNRKGTRLKNTAIPTKLLRNKALSDAVFKTFPYKIASDPTVNEPQPDVLCQTSQSHEHEIFTNPDIERLNSNIQIEISNTEDAEDDAQSDGPIETLVTGWQDEQDVEKNFSWQKQPEVAVDLAADEPDDYSQDDLSLYCSDDEDRGIYGGITDGTVGHVGFHCNVCTKDIVGYRYVCVQCSDFDLCSSCEANGEHDHHYVLRIPGPRPYQEVQTVLARIRKHLMIASDPISSGQNADNDCISVKSEIKEENEDVEEQINQEEDEQFEEVERLETDEESQDMVQYESQDRVRDDNNEMAQSDDDSQGEEVERLESDDESHDGVQDESQERVQDDNNEMAQSDDDGQSEEDPLAKKDTMDTESDADSDDVWIPSKEELRLAAIERSSDEPKTKRIPKKHSALHKAHCKPVQMHENARIDMNKSNSDSKNMFIQITNIESRQKKRILISKSDFEKYLKLQPSEKRIRLIQRVPVNRNVVNQNPSSVEEARVHRKETEIPKSLDSFVTAKGSLRKC